MKLASLFPNQSYKTGGGSPSNQLVAVSHASYDSHTDLVLDCASLVRHNLDSHLRIAPADHPSTMRIQGIAGRILHEPPKQELHRVYLEEQVGILSFPDGSLRIFFPLMDMLDDDELCFILCHELAHIALGHTLGAARFRILSWLARSEHGCHGEGGLSLAPGQLKELESEYLQASYSNVQEHEADDWSIMRLNESGNDLAAIITAMRKLQRFTDAARFLGGPSVHHERFRRLRLAIFPDALRNA